MKPIGEFYFDLRKISVVVFVWNPLSLFPVVGG